MSIISQFGQILGIAGINAYRNFIPAFCYVLIIQWGLHGTCCPEAIQTFAANSPDILKNEYLAIALGILALVELIANFQTELREWYESSEVTRGLKALMSILITFAFLSTRDAETIQQTLTPVQTAGISLISLFAFFNGCLTWYFSLLHNGLTTLVRMIDPDNDFKLHTLLAALEDAFCAFMLILTIFLPIILIILILGILLFGYLIRIKLREMEKQRNHPCEKCGSLVLNAAEICWHCHTPQPKVCNIGIFGLPTNDEVPTHGMKKHHLNLLFSRRCPACAELLHTVDVCTKCQQHIWQYDLSSKDYLAALDKRFFCHLIFCLLLGWIPILGVIPILFFRFKVMIPTQTYQTTTNKILGRILKLLFRILKMAACILFGLTCPLLLLIPYLFLYLFYRSKIQKI